MLPTDNDAWVPQSAVAAHLGRSLSFVERLRVSGMMPYRAGRPVMIRVRDVRDYESRVTICRAQTPGLDSASIATAGCGKFGGPIQRRAAAEGAADAYQQGKHRAKRQRYSWPDGFNNQKKMPR